MLLTPYFHDEDPEVCMTAIELAILKEDDATAKVRFSELLTERHTMSVAWKRVLAPPPPDSKGVRSDAPLP